MEEGWMEEWEQDVTWCRSMIQAWMDPSGEDERQWNEGEKHPGEEDQKEEQRFDGHTTKPTYRCPHPNAVEAPSYLDRVQTHRLFAETNEILNRTFQQCCSKVQLKVEGQCQRYITEHRPAMSNKPPYPHANTKSQRVAMLRNLMGKIRKQRCRTLEQLCWLQPAYRQYLWGGSNEATTLRLAETLLDSVYREAGEHLQQIQGTKRSKKINRIHVKPQQLLKEWLFANFLHPYPSDKDRRELAEATGISESQVSTWFINARVRFWKPFIEDLVREK